MTRAKEITKEAKKFAKEIEDWEIAEDVQDAFEQGAQWADAHPHWISVENELPPRNVFVLTCDGQENENLLMLAGDDRWYDKAVGLHRNITHWMPMPSVEHLRETTKMIEKGGEE